MKRFTRAGLARYLWRQDGCPEGRWLGETNKGTYRREVDRVVKGLGVLGFKVVPKKSPALPAIVENRGGALAHVLRYSDMTHESDDPRGPWWPIKNGKFTKRYVSKRVTP